MSPSRGLSRSQDLVRLKAAENLRALRVCEAHGFIRGSSVNTGQTAAASCRCRGSGRRRVRPQQPDQVGLVHAPERPADDVVDGVLIAGALASHVYLSAHRIFLRVRGPMRVKLPHLDAWTTNREQNAARYTDLFTRCGLTDVIGLPAADPRGRHVWNQYVIRVADGKRDALRAHLSGAGVGTEIYYPVPLHQQACFSYLGWNAGDLPVTEQAAAETLALPIFPELEPAEQQTVVGRIAQFFGRSPTPPDIARADKGSDAVAAPRQLSRTGLIGSADDVRC